MDETSNIDRRRFLKTSAALSGGLLMSFYLPTFGKTPKVASSAAPATFEPNAFIRIGADNSITIICNHSEMGQGTYTSMSQLIADELDADWKSIQIESAPLGEVYANPIFKAQLTGNSMTAYTEWERMRTVGASARSILVQAAARAWNVDPASCQTKNSTVIHPATNRRFSYGELVDKASGITAPNDVKLKSTADFTYIGKPVKRLDTPDKTNGKAMFGLDVSIPGMLVAVVARTPVFGGKLKSFNADKAKAIPGVRHVVQIDRGVAVVADGYWPAKLGREALEIEWDEGPFAAQSSATQRQQYAQMAKTAGKVAQKEGDVAKAKGTKTINAVYEFPYLAHAPMEPLNCVADVKDDSCELYLGTQAQTFDQFAAAQASGLKPEQIKIHTQLLGGGFGRRSVLDGHVIQEAVQVSKAIKAPVKVMWSREDDIRGGYYRTVSYHNIRGVLAASGQPAAWSHDIVNESFIIGTPLAGSMVKDGIDEIAVEGAAELPYEIPNVQVNWHQAVSPIPTLWMRSVGHSYNAFVKETFIDDLARTAGQDPYQYRRKLLEKQPRLKQVLELAAQKGDWGKPLPKGHARGIAVHHSYFSYVAQVAEVSITPSGKVKVHRVVCAVDCGPVINPDTVKAQVEGSVIFGLTSAFYGELTLEKGRIQQRNFHDYKMLRMNEAPDVEVHIVPSTDKMGGIGEPAVPPIAPAVANALFTLTGKRIRKLPFPADVRA